MASLWFYRSSLLLSIDLRSNLSIFIQEQLRQHKEMNYVLQNIIKGFREHFLIAYAQKKCLDYFVHQPLLTKKTEQPQSTRRGQ